MKNVHKIALTLSSITILGVGGIAQYAYAIKNTIPSIAAANPKMEASDGEMKDDQEEAKESSKLQALAKISAQQAQKSAQVSYPGVVRGVQLENDNGNLVYAVSIDQKEIKVDAGNGQVLYAEVIETEGERDNKDDKTSDASRPRSTIQVTEEKDIDSELGELKILP